MGYSDEHIARKRADIIECAGQLMREHGYEGVSIGQIMKATGSTHGGFYAHFDSKESLFDAVVSEQFDFVTQIKGLAEKGLPESKHLNFAIEQYLNPERIEQIGKSCTMASSAVDIAGRSKTAKRGFTNAFLQLVDEFQSRIKGRTRVKREAALASIALSVGALVLSRAMSDHDLIVELLDSASMQAKQIVSDAG
ncbi:MAG: TetR/AcrR family transcriptional regulator [Pseudomonadota bacterium]